MLYLLATGSFQKLKFETCVQSRLSSSIAFSHCSLVLSRETPRISKPSWLYFLYNLTRLGFSTLHGLHHAAQKSRRVTVLLWVNSLKVILDPSILGAVKSGAISPTSIGSSYWTNKSAMFFPTLLTFILLEKFSYTSIILSLLTLFSTMKTSNNRADIYESKLSMIKSHSYSRTSLSFAL